MDNWTAFLNGQFVPSADAVLPVTDGGVVQGTTISEQLRTFGGQLFRLATHVERLFHSLHLVGIEPSMAPDEFARVGAELAERNHRLLVPGDDLGLTMLVTPGPFHIHDAAPTVVMHSFPLRFGSFADKYAQGESLSTVDVMQVPARCWPPELKCRSRMHYYLADRQAHQRHPGSRALMQDAEGFITETSTANVVLFRRGEGLLMPPAQKVLPGISLGMLLELADSLGIAHEHRDLSPADVAGSDEVMITSTSPCVLPVVRFNGRAIGSGQPGGVFRRLLSAWSARVGLDIPAQASRFATRPQL